MSRYLKNIIIYVLVLIPVLGSAQLKQDDSIHFVNMEVVVEDIDMLQNAEIQFEMCKDGINSLYLSPRDKYTFKITAASTRIVVPLTTAINYGIILYTHNQNKKEPFAIGENLFIFENGDDVKVVLTKNNFSFSGKGSAKYNYLKTIGKQVDRLIRSNSKALAHYNSGNYKGWIYGRIAQIDSLFDAVADKLKWYRADISPSIYHQLEVDNWARYNKKILNLLSTKAIGHPDTNYNKAFRQVFTEIFSAFDANRFDQESLAKSYYYVDYLYHRQGWATTYAINDGSADKLKQYAFEDVYKSIRKSDGGLIRDKLTLITFSADAIRSPDAKNFISDAIKMGGANKYTEKLKEMEMALMGNVFPFELPDATGKVHKLDDFKGKLIVMDFWYTGCIPCRFLAKALKPIVSSYKNNPNIVFITVSIDGSKKRGLWLKSLRDETYTSNDELNLLAPDGKDSEIVKFYNIQGYPALFLISKEGKMITTAPPRPGLDNPEDTAAFKELINKYL